MEKIQIKLAGWKANLLSQGGRLTLIKSTLSSMPLYTLDCFKVPSPISNKIDQTVRNLWSRHNTSGIKLHMMSWERICQATEHGGLGIRRTEEMDRAMLEEEDFPEVAPKGKFSWVWKSIFSGRDVCMKGSDIQIWSGDKTIVEQNKLALVKDEARG
ncbi:hypothetical protein DITRI_Ditri17bG0069600 [Diplodiscus trichospermus]